MGEHVLFDPACERRRLVLLALKAGIGIGQRFVRRRRERAFKAGKFLVRNQGWAALEVLPFGLDLAREFGRRQFLDQNFDPRLVLVVAPAVEVVHAQYRIEVIAQFGAWQKLANRMADHRGAAEAAAGDDARADFTFVIFDDLNADIVNQNGGAIFGAGIDGDLEFARQVGEFGVERRPLANQFAVRTRVDDFIVCDAGKMVRRGVAHAVAAGLDCVHLDAGEIGQNVRHFFELGPVVLDVLPRGEVAVVAVVLARDVAQHAHLL